MSGGKQASYSENSGREIRKEQKRRRRKRKRVKKPKVDKEGAERKRLGRFLIFFKRHFNDLTLEL